MKNYIYIFYNKLSKRYESVMAFPSDEFAIHQFNKMKVPADEYELCRVGSFSIETGLLETECPVRLTVQNDVSLPTSKAN